MWGLPWSGNIQQPMAILTTRYPSLPMKHFLSAMQRWLWRSQAYISWVVLPKRLIALSQVLPYLAAYRTLKPDLDFGFARRPSRPVAYQSLSFCDASAAIVAKDEFVEIGVHMLAAQAVVRAETPSLQQREDPMNPRQHDMSRHLADHAGIVPVIGQSGIGCVAVGEQRGYAPHIRPHEGFDRSGGIVHDHGEADAARARIEIFCVLASRLGLIDVAIDHLDGADDEDFSCIAAIEKLIASTEGDFGLIDFDDSLQRLPIRIDHRSAQLLRQEPGGSVGEAELILQLPRRHAIGMRRHEMCRPEPCRQRQLGAVHRRPRRDRSLTTAARAFVSVSPALQRRRAAHG